ncbi:MAG TPA: hypothetical protein VH598_11770, partial [Verrucomicrobiae bacterium]|nr:hypothetical protein [Verrucomicrobiae bacterium]
QQKLTNLDAMVGAEMQKMGTNLYREAKTPEEAKARLREDIIREAELTLAHKPASEFAMDLEKAQPPNAEGFAKIAAQKGLTVRVTPPFDEDNGPAGMEVPQIFTRSAFKLNQEEPFTGAIKGEDAFYVVALKGTNKVEVPSFQSIHDKVVEDYRRDQALELARIDGAGFASTVTNAMVAGKTFETICADAKVKPVKLPPFSLSTREMPEVENEISFSLLKQYAFITPAGKASGLIRTKNGGVILHVVAQLPVDEAKMKTDLPKFITYLRQVRENEAFNFWINEQIRHDPPFMQTVQKVMQESQMSNPPRRAAR